MSDIFEDTPEVDDPISEERLQLWERFSKDPLRGLAFFKKKELLQIIKAIRGLRKDRDEARNVARMFYDCASSWIEELAPDGLRQGWIQEDYPWLKQKS